MHDVTISDSFKLAGRRPRRPLFSFVLRRYDRIQTVGLAIILLLTTFRHALIWTLMWISAYLLYRLFMTRSRGRASSFIKGSNEGQLVRASILLIGVFVYLLYIYLGTNYLADVGYLNPLWLLFLWPVFILSQHARSRYFSISLFAATIGVIILDWLAVSRLPFPDPDTLVNLSLAILAKALSLVLLAFAHYVFVRYIMDQSQDLRLIYEVSRQVIDARDEQSVLDRVVNLISANLHYPSVHVFQVEPDGSLLCVAGAGAEGRERVQRGFSIPLGVGIVGHVAQTGNLYAANDVSQLEGVYFADINSDPAAPKPRAEVALPIKSWGQLTAILDVQAYDRGHFIPFDIDVLTMMADYIGWIQSSRHEILYREKVAHNLLSPENWNLALTSTIEAAQKELGAHSIVLFENDATSKSQRGVAYAGRLAQEDLRKIDWSIVNPNGLVSRLMNEKGSYFQEDVAHTTIEEPLFSSSPDHRRLNLLTFAQRYHIHSRAIFVLRQKGATIGVLFINYSNRHTFSREEQKRLTHLAEVIEAALYRDQIQRAQRASDLADIERERRFLREELVNDVHDVLLGTTAALNEVLRHLIGQASAQVAEGQEDNQFGEGMLKGLRNARMASDLLLADIVFLAHTNTAAFRGDFRDVIGDILEITRRCYAIEPKPLSILDEWNGNPDQVPTGVTLAMKAILSEVLFNAIRRFKAQNLHLTFDIDEVMLNVDIVYDGREAATYKGHAQEFPSTSIGRRVERIGGKLETSLSTQGEIRIRIETPILPRYIWETSVGTGSYLGETSSGNRNG